MLGAAPMYEVKVYIVQSVAGKVLDAKLTREAAQSSARLHAPASVTVMVADKQLVGPKSGPPQPRRVVEVKFEH
jgi:hypothetical protein